jgi:hypothetical protein
MKQSTRRTYALWESDRKSLLPYGVWGLVGRGDRVLFNRRYEAIYARDWQKNLIPIERNHRYAVADQRFFYDDATPGFDKIRQALAALAEWGIDPPKGWMKAYAKPGSPP